ncbi:glycosyltransferase family 2 protein [Chryseobacterium lactis]|uniref:Glycosyltransferase family 2 protein n=1 Tax=Chryseobacterium lactis TaxID=1241981 RepID=A0A3G6RYQ7_CHRLC|nr:glycosyltransferase family 2 protein [Chryseobacterium lactis]AZA81722.1 glycosyltransferase family 2 protein [Chryseobacterium lactis]AZB06720.1 glycosyltransferase family 2 protein [Chryseobacterium lactis]PNW15571.1 glycosyltransferase family 2 protein [Chryseobacterium lactis]
MAKISVIIVTYNAMKWAERCFTSLRHSSVPVTCIVIDNGSTDGTQEYIKTQFPEVDFIQSPENAGFGKANNMGIEKAYKQETEFFYLMNQDAWIYPDSFQQLLDVYHSHPDQNQIGIMSPMHLDGSEKKLDLHFENYLAKDLRNNRMLSDIYFDEAKPYYEISFVNAAHWWIPRKAIEKVGGFNPYFFHGAEDYEYIHRVSYFGLKIIVCSKSKVVHDTVQSFYKKEPKDKAEALKTARLSMQMQRETKYLDPNYDYNIKREKTALLSYLLKMGAKGNMSEARFYKDQYQYFSKKFGEIEAARKISMTAPHPFLNL